VPANQIGVIDVEAQLDTATKVVTTTVDAATFTLDPSRVLAIGVTLATQTGVPIAAVKSLEDPQGLNVQTQATLFVAVDSAGTDAETSVARNATFDTSLLKPEFTQTSDLEVGGLPTARSLLRFDIPPFILDSSTIVSATLQLVPTAPAVGVPGEMLRVVARAVRADLGRKSPVTNDTAVALVEAASQDTVEFNFSTIAGVWRTDPDRPRALVLVLEPEASTIGSVRFGGSTTASAIPTVKLIFSRPFRFEKP
jgi:hypothetical protein